jgi:hypothetical protein
MSGFFGLFSRKRRRAPAAFLSSRSADAPSSPDPAQLYRIEFEMMLKGSIHKRRKGAVRQFGVTVNGATRLVTSGDVVDQDTYHALLAAGAIRPIPAETSPSSMVHTLVDPVVRGESEE